jgi:hypothetical protein
LGVVVHFPETRPLGKIQMAEPLSPLTCHVSGPALGER